VGRCIQGGHPRDLEISGWTRKKGKSRGAKKNQEKKKKKGGDAETVYGERPIVGEQKEKCSQESAKKGRLVKN